MKIPFNQYDYHNPRRIRRIDACSWWIRIRETILIISRQANAVPSGFLSSVCRDRRIHSGVGTSFWSTKPYRISISIIPAISSDCPL